MTILETNLKNMQERGFSGDGESFKGFKIPDLQAVMSKIQDQGNWKAAWSAAVHHSMVGAVLVAIEFFHADKAKVIGIQPLTGFVLMEGNGYQAW